MAWRDGQVSRTPESEQWSDLPSVHCEASGPAVAIRHDLILKFVLPLILYSFKLVAVKISLGVSKFSIPSLLGNDRSWMEISSREILLFKP